MKAIEEVQMDNITAAEFMSDLIGMADDLNFNKYTVAALCKARYETMCIYSPIGKHRCQVPIMFTPQSGMETIGVDTCLQAEITQLVRKHGIHPIGSCCGHGRKQGYIQVRDEDVQKMHQLNYKVGALEKHAEGVNAFVPKTILYIDHASNVENTRMDQKREPINV